MIFVSVGTNEARFDRLLRAVEMLPVDEDVVVQHGHSSPIAGRHVRAVDFLSFAEMQERMREARVFVTHAGVGSVMVGLANGKKPVVVPRRKAFGEAVDDHQLQLGRRFAEAGLVTLVEAPADLGNALEHAEAATAVSTGSSTLAADLRSFLGEAIAASGP